LCRYSFYLERLGFRFCFRLLFGSKKTFSAIWFVLGILWLVIARKQNREQDTNN
jgi:hypothetical protein